MAQIWLNKLLGLKSKKLQVLKSPRRFCPLLEELEVRLTPSDARTTFVVMPDDGSSPSGYTPIQILTAYGFYSTSGANNISFNGTPGNGAGQTIAIVDAYNDPNIASDLAAFDSQFNLPAPPSFSVLNQNGQTSPLPGVDPSGGWEVEESLDVEWAHAMAPGASIDLVEANSASNDLFTADVAAAGLPGVSAVSNSWSGGEESDESSFDSDFTHAGVTFLASTGDDGSPAGYPAYSSNVVAVGGTTLNINSNNSYGSETAWSGSGGGTSVYESEPTYQDGVQSTGNRTAPDVAMDADPNTGVSVYDSYPNSDGFDEPWSTVGGTSVSCPCWAGVIAIINQGRVADGGTAMTGSTQTLPGLYSLPSSDFNQITSGSNGGFSANPNGGYNEVTGLGTPKAYTGPDSGLIYDMVNYSTVPAVTAVSPASGPASGGTSVTITGTGFSGATAVKFGAINATSFTVNSATQITATDPAGSGTVDITVTTVGGTSANSASDHFVYSNLPVVTGVNPNAGPTAGGTSIVITGGGFTGTTAVEFGGVNAASFIVNSGSQITAIDPAGTGAVDITVTNAYGTSAASSADQFTYVAAPTVTSVSPSGGPSGGGTSVVITGTGFSGATAVKFGASNATSFTVNSATQITATDSAGSGAVDVTVTTAGGTSATSSADQFTYSNLPDVTGVSPSSGPSGGGTSVVITGGAFTGATAVLFGTGAATSFTVNSATQITATDPAGSGTVDVTVITAYGSSATSSADQFTYNNIPVVTFSSTDIADSSATITINGSGFSTTPASNAVVFNLGLAGTVTSATASQLVVTISVPPTALGSLTAVVTSNGLGSGAAVQVATEINGTWIVSSSSGSGGSLSAPTLPYAVSHYLGGDQITFSGSLSGATISLSGVLTLNHNVIITGLGVANLAISGNNADQVFSIPSGVMAAISSLTIENGAGSSGGGVTNSGTLTLSNDTISDSSADESGGGIFNASGGILTLSDSTLTGNSAYYGGGLTNSGTMTVANSTIANNSAQSTGGGIVSYGGAMTLSNSTIFGNSAYGTGGGIDDYSGAMTLSADTIANNSANEGGGIGFTNGGTMKMLDTIVANNSASNGPDIDGTIAVGNYDLVDNTSGLTISSGTGNHLGVSAGLASALANNGGPTQTLALQTGSLAISNGGALTSIATGHPVGISDTTIYVQNSKAIAQTSGNYYILIGQEEMLVTSVSTSANTLTVQRGVNGTTAATHAAGVSVFLALDQRGVTRPTPPDIGAFQLQATVTSSAADLPANSTSITINGSGFDTTIANDSVAFSNGVTGTVTAATGFSLTVSLTGLSSVAGGTALDASVTVDGVSSGSAVQVATVLQVVTAISPNAGPAAGGMSVTITGAGFTGATAVNFGAVAATSFTVNSPTQITAIEPAGSGTVDVTVLSSAGASPISPADDFTYVAAPTVTSVSPASGPAAGGTSVNIFGTGFSGATTVSFGGISATIFTVVSSTEITATDPAGSGIVDVTVTSPVGGTSATSSADKFTYNAATSTSITSNPVGPITQGDSVDFTASISGSPSVGTVSFYYDYGAADQFQIGGAVDVAGGSATSDATTALPAGSDTITAVYSGGIGFAGSQGTNTVQVTSAAPPSISSVVANQDISALYNAAGQPFVGAQRSMVDDIVYTFSEPVNIIGPSADPNAFTIAVASGWTGNVPTLNWAPVAGSGNTQWAVTFSGSSVSGGSIANGAYTITVNDLPAITAVSDGQQLTVTPGIAPAAGNPGFATQQFYRLYGDINGDEVVNASDNLQIKAALTTYNAALDYNDDGTVNAADNLKFKNDLTVNFSGFTPTI